MFLRTKIILPPAGLDSGRGNGQGAWYRGNSGTQATVAGAEQPQHGRMHHDGAAVLVLGLLKIIGTYFMSVCPMDMAMMITLRHDAAGYLCNGV